MDMNNESNRIQSNLTTVPPGEESEAKKMIVRDAKRLDSSFLTGHGRKIRRKFAFRSAANATFGEHYFILQALTW